MNDDIRHPDLLGPGGPGVLADRGAPGPVGTNRLATRPGPDVVAICATQRLLS